MALCTVSRHRELRAVPQLLRALYQAVIATLLRTFSSSISFCAAGMIELLVMPA